MKIESKSLVHHAQAIVSKERTPITSNKSENKGHTHIDEKKLRSQYNSIKNSLYSSQYKITELQNLKTNLDKFILETNKYNNNTSESNRVVFYKSTGKLIQELNKYSFDNEKLAKLIDLHLNSSDKDSINNIIRLSQNISLENQKQIDTIQVEIQKLLISLENITSLNYQAISDTNFIEAKNIPKRLFNINIDKIKEDLLKG